MAALIDLTGLTYGDLTITGRAGNNPGNNSATWNAHCTCGHDTIVRGDYVRTGQTRNCGHRGRHPRTHRDIPVYTTVHARLRRTLGKASNHQCACGSPAAVWAFTGCDEAIITNGLAPYCAHSCPDEYEAACNVCASLLDAIVRETVAA